MRIADRFGRVSTNAILVEESANGRGGLCISSEAQLLSNGRVIVRGTRIRTSSGGRDKKHVFIELECLPEEAPVVQQALSIILQRHGRINASAF